MSSSKLETCLLALSRVARRYSGLVIAGAVLLFVVSLSFAWFHLEFQTDRADLIGSDDKFFSAQEKFLNEFPLSDDVVVMVEGGDAHRRKAFVDLLAETLRRHPDHFFAVFPRVEIPFLLPQALFFLDEKDLEDLVDSVEEAKPFFATLDSEAGLESLFEDLGDESSSSAKFASMLPFLNGVFKELDRAVESRGRALYQSPWGETLFPGASKELADGMASLNTTTYHTVDGGRSHLLLVRLRSNDGETIALLRRLVGETQKAFPELITGVTGEPLLEYDEMVSSETDSHRSAVLSLILVGLLFGLSFRQVGRPLAAIFCLTLAVGWTIGFTTLAVGHLNLLTVSFATILIGLGIDFGIHLLFRYEEEFRKTGKTDLALDDALLACGSDIVVGALSTATAFWAVGFTDFKGVSEIGIIAGAGVMLCLLSTLIVLPALIAKMDRNRKYDIADSLPLGGRIMVAQAESQLLRRSPLILVATILFIFLAWPRVASVGFDYNLLRLQDPNLESVQTELALINKGGNSALFSVAVADDLNQAREKKELFDALSTVAKVEVISELFPQKSAAKIESLRRLQSLLEEVEVSAASAKTEQLNGSRLKEMGRGFEQLNSLFEAEKSTLLRHRDKTVRVATVQFQEQRDSLFEKLSKLGPGPIEDSLGAFQSSFFQDLGVMIGFLKQQDPDFVFGLDDLPDNLKIRSVGKTGKILLRIYPKENIWEREALAEFVNQVAEADREAIGAPLLILHHTSLLKGAFESSGLYALVAVTLLLLCYFRSVGWTLLAMFPLGLGVYFMLFVMATTGVHFNPANFMGLPLLLGIGLDFGIHVLHRVKEEGRANMFDHSTGPATLVSGLTTIFGFGTLALGGHQGVASLGLVLAAGVTGIVFAALVVLPAVMNMFWKSDLKQDRSSLA